MVKLLAAALMAVFGVWPSTHYAKDKAPETQEERVERRDMSAKVVAKVAKDNETGFNDLDAAALISMKWKWESGNLEYFVHAGGVSPIGHQDHGNAVCLGQIQTWKNNKHLPTKEDHRALAGLSEEATERCARMTLTYFWGHAQRCIRTKIAKEKRWREPLLDYEVSILSASYGAGHCAPVEQRHKNHARTFRKIHQYVEKSIEAARRAEVEKVARVELE